MEGSRWSVLPCRKDPNLSKRCRKDLTLTAEINNISYYLLEKATFFLMLNDLLAGLFMEMEDFI